MLAVEWRGAHHITAADQRRIGDLARAAALALDNARWLDRIHGLGVEQERSRLARELHDHIGQSVVYLGFEIDRLVELNHGRAVQERPDLPPWRRPQPGGGAARRPGRSP